jgi:hypothetical protein
MKMAGKFYPADPVQLRKAVASSLADAVSRPVADPVALVAPHAGYVFSAQIAADAYEQAASGGYATIVVLGTNHTVAPFDGGAIWPKGAFRTPLGDAAVDEAFADRLLASGAGFVSRKDAHVEEHSIEVQLPFVQTLFPGAKVVPIVIGTADLSRCRALGDAIAAAAEALGRKVLVVASTDLAHYPSAEDADRVDRHLLAAIASGDLEEVKRVVTAETGRAAPGLSTCACGEGAVLTMMEAAGRMGAAHGAVASYANSGDTVFGDTKRVVGYGAVVFGKGARAADLSGLEAPHPAAESRELSAGEKRVLLGEARRAIDRYLESRTAPLSRPVDPVLWVGRGVFVTLKKGGELRGCIGHMSEDRPLCQVVGAMALQAAFNDRRFEPLASEEWGSVEIEISALTPSREVRRPEEIVVGRDGVVIEKSGRSAVFLPQVAPEQGWNREELLEHLCAKAGLPGGAWREGARLSVFQAEVFAERDFR